jgi:hypothetical protein
VFLFVCLFFDFPTPPGGDSHTGFFFFFFGQAEI